MSREYPKANCNNCCKKDVCRYIEEKNKIGRELEEIINKIESNTLPLDESMVLFEEGRKLIKEVNELLKETEEKIVNIVKDN